MSDNMETYKIIKTPHSMGVIPTKLFYELRNPEKPKKYKGINTCPRCKNHIQLNCAICPECTQHIKWVEVTNNDETRKIDTIRN